MNNNTDALLNERLWYAVIRDDIGEGSDCISQGADVNATISCLGTLCPALHLAVQFARPSFVQLLLQHKANVNTKNEADDTPLHVAAKRHGDAGADIAQWLIKYGAAINEKTEIFIGETCFSRETPLHYAALLGNDSVAQVLISEGADLNIVNHANETALHVAMAGLSNTEDSYLNITQMMIEGILLENPDAASVHFLSREVLPLEYGEVSTFWNTCQKEIKEEIAGMKRYQVGKAGHCLYSVYTEDNPERLAVICTPPVLEAIKELNVQKKFPHHTHRISHHLAIGEQRRQVRSLIQHVLVLMEKNDIQLPLEMWDKITENFSVKEIQNIIKAGFTPKDQCHTVPQAVAVPSASIGPGFFTRFASGDEQRETQQEKPTLSRS